MSWMLEVFKLLSVPALGLNGLIEHADGQRDFVATTFGSAFEEYIVAFGLEAAIGVGAGLLRLITRKPKRWSHVVSLSLRKP